MVLLSRLLQSNPESIRTGMSEAEFRIALEAVVQRLPDMVRADLASRDPAVRQGAEETLVARIMATMFEMRQAA